MKKILVLIPIIAFVGAIILNPVVPSKKEATPTTNVVSYMSDPGTGW
ncbi:hypothetical protein NYE71_32345 [Bacillus sp. FSL K6-0273]|nr:MULTISPECIES: hypothetical protein [Bacillus cereus group]MDA2281043.1 hypothetical protein [Bacillus cereus]MDA2722236.1 hypothetical protein [Bacillus cereus]MDA2727885.1 hypothetical protein [Bacillus cereus]WMW41390.1 hypothetical protein RE433_29080 [Bacillus cereus]HDR8052114.1 hypothetical protein [Bacillus cereus]